MDIFYIKQNQITISRWEACLERPWRTISRSSRILCLKWTGFWHTVPAIKHGRFSLLCQNTPLMGTETKMDDSILFPVKSSYIFGKEHANWSSISGVMIGLSWKIKFRKINYLFCQNANLKCQNTLFIGTETKMDDFILFPMKNSYIFW